MAQEIERKFLVSGDFKSFAFASEPHRAGIYQQRPWTDGPRTHYVTDKGYLTIKGASNASGTSRYEWEKELSLVARRRN